MKLGLGSLRPGKVLEVSDNFGTIKCSCCGIFSEEDDTEMLPPVIPFRLAGINSFSSVKKGDEVWVLTFEDNPQELFYIRKDTFKENIKDILEKDYKFCEVIASRETPEGFIQLYFNDGDGWIIRHVNSVIQIRKDGSILLDAGSAHRKIDISDDSISIGSIGTSAHTAAYGDKVVASLNKLDNIISAIEEAANKLPYTMGISAAIKATQQMFSDSIEEIESPHVTID